MESFIIVMTTENNSFKAKSDTRKYFSLVLSWLNFININRLELFVFVFLSKRSELLGDMLVGLRWKKNDEILEISIEEASNLKVMDEDRITTSKLITC